MLTTVNRMNDKVEVMAELMKEQQRRINELKTCILRLDTLLKLAPNRSALLIQLLADSGRDAGSKR